MADYPEQRSGYLTAVQVQSDEDDSEHRVRQTVARVSDSLGRVEHQYHLLEDRIGCVLGGVLPTATITDDPEPPDELELVNDLRSLCARCEVLADKLSSARRRCAL